MSSFRIIANSNLLLPQDTYVYRIIATQQGLASLCSDDSLHILNPLTLAPASPAAVQKVNRSVTCLEPFVDNASGSSPNTVITTGRDGLVKFWDLRTARNVLQMEAKTDRQLKQSLSAVVADANKNTLVAGAELEGRDGPGDAPIFVWDTRKASAPRHVYTESHTDTVTALTFHPSHASLLLTASTDGLINLIDTAVADEDEAVYQVFNHKSALHHAGFLDGVCVFGLGTDETLTFYAITDVEAEEPGLEPVVLGDVRARLKADYVVNLSSGGNEPWLAVGSYSEKRLELVPLAQKEGGPGSIPWSLEEGLATLSLQGAHGEEIVRDVLVDASEQNPTVYTCGEDGVVKAWKGDQTNDTDAQREEPTSKAIRTKPSQSQSARFSPYGKP